MKTVTGPIERVGSSTLNQALNIRRYSVIKIGEHVLKGVTIYEGMDAFLNPSTRSSTIHYVNTGILGRFIVGLHNGDGDYYQSKMPTAGLVTLWILGLILSPIIIGFFFLTPAMAHTFIALQARHLPPAPAGKRWIRVH